MDIDKELQQKILKMVNSNALGSTMGNDLMDALAPKGDEESLNHLLANLKYLTDHQLVRTDWLHFHGIAIPSVVFSTAQGVDYLEEDGGLTAEFNTVTVKFDVDNIRELMELGLLQAKLPDEKKSLLKKAIAGASATTLQTAVSKLVEYGMSNPQAALKAVAAAFGITI